MSDRQLAAAGIRRGLEFWPDANHWCQGRLADVGPNGEQQRCTQQMLCDGLGIVDTITPRSNVAFRVAEAEICRIAEARGIRSSFGNACVVNNNSTDFATLKNIVETAAVNLEKPA